MISILVQLVDESLDNLQREQLDL